MGKRSRKRGGPVAEAPRDQSTRAERDAARRRRQEAGAVGRPLPGGGRLRPGERPPAPWGKFPLTELVVLLSLVLLVLGFVTGGTRGGIMIGAGLAVGSLAGLELSIRDHFAGHRSHSTLLAAACAVPVMAVVYLLAGPGTGAFGLAVAAGAVIFALALWRAREAFKKRSGGVAFR